MIYNCHAVRYHRLESFPSTAEQFFSVNVRVSENHDRQIRSPEYHISVHLLQAHYAWMNFVMDGEEIRPLQLKNVSPLSYDSIFNK